MERNPRQGVVLRRLMPALWTALALAAALPTLAFGGRKTTLRQLFRRCRPPSRPLFTG
jgi:hypothetical protein